MKYETEHPPTMMNQSSATYSFSHFNSGLETFQMELNYNEVTSKSSHTHSHLDTKRKERPQSVETDQILLILCDQYIYGQKDVICNIVSLKNQAKGSLSALLSDGNKFSVKNLQS